jgi:hypothetical protein
LLPAFDKAGLGLQRARITGAGLELLRGLPHLERLSLVKTPIGDAGLEHLTGLIHLRKLDLRFVQVADTGTNRPRKAVPDCRLVFEWRLCAGEPLAGPGQE